MPMHRSTRILFVVFVLVLLGLVLSLWLSLAQAATPRLDPTSLSLEQLLAIEIVSVSKRPEAARTTPAAVHVITAEDIRRSGATSLPEVLRLAPGVQVSRGNASQWAIGIRGFTNLLSRGVLVLIDGRSVYSPLDAGVFWDAQQPPLETIERIEVIRGPGGTVWGANAVNGVINVMTKSALEGQGGTLSVRGGTQDSARGFLGYGASLSPTIAARGYATGLTQGGDVPHTGPTVDAWHLGQAGARLDWRLPGDDHLTVQGDLSSGVAGRQSNATFLHPLQGLVQRGDVALSGGNLLARWTHPLTSSADVAVQAYYDRTERRELLFQDVRDTGDLDTQLHWRLPWQQDVIATTGYRATSGLTTSSNGLHFTPATRTEQLWRLSLQDRIAVWPERLTLTLGSKLEHNDYSGLEVQPTVRLTWTPSEQVMLWGAVTRAVRTPSRFERELGIQVITRPSPLVLAQVFPDNQFRAESLLAYEAGVRASLTPHLLVDVTVFANQHQRLLSLEPGAPLVARQPLRVIIPAHWRNGLHGENAGLEVLAQWQALPWWRVTGTYSYLYGWFAPTPGSLDRATAATLVGNSPRHQGSVRSAWTLPYRLDADVAVRYMDGLPAQHVASYVTLDARLGWQATKTLGLALVGTNLLTPQHAEWDGGGTLASEVPRSISGEVVWQW